MSATPSAPAPGGVLVIDKPAGPTSHDAVARVRRALRTREVGHAGTLDPMATGVLVVAVGEATKLVPWLTTTRKRYRAMIALGVETDSLDACGRVVSTRDVRDDVRLALASGDAGPVLAEAVAGERARTSQVPPSFSAIHSGGERAYAKARRGEAVALEARPVAVHELTIVDVGLDPPRIGVELEVSKGYYVRSLARDLAAALGTVGHLSALRRTRSGGFEVGRALALDASAADLEAHLVPLADAAAAVLPTARLTEAGAVLARHGRTVPKDEIRTAADLPCPGCAWLDPTGQLVAVGELDAAGAGRVLRGFGAR